MNKTKVTSLILAGVLTTATMVPAYAEVIESVAAEPVAVEAEPQENIAVSADPIAEQEDSIIVSADPIEEDTIDSSSDLIASWEPIPEIKINRAYTDGKGNFWTDEDYIIPPIEETAAEPQENIMVSADVINTEPEDNIIASADPVEEPEDDIIASADPVEEPEDDIIASTDPVEEPEDDIITSTDPVENETDIPKQEIGVVVDRWLPKQDIGNIPVLPHVYEKETPTWINGSLEGNIPVLSEN